MHCIALHPIVKLSSRHPIPLHTQHPLDPLPLLLSSIAVVVHEVSLSLEELLVVPHIIFIVYEQQMGIPSSRLIDTCGEQKHLNNNTSSTTTSTDCGVNQVLTTFIGNAPNKTMIAYMPHGIDVSKFDRLVTPLY